MGAVHYHAFLPPRSLAPLNDKSTFEPKVHALHVVTGDTPVRFPASGPNNAAANSTPPRRAPPATNASGSPPGWLGTEQRASTGTSDRQTRDAGVEQISSDMQKGTAAGKTTEPEDWPPQTESAGSLPVRRSRRLRFSDIDGNDQNQDSLNHNSYSRLSSSLGSELSVSQSRQWPASGPPASVSNLPRWNLPALSKLTPLGDLLIPPERPDKVRRAAVQRKRVALICCVITVTPPTGRPRRQPRTLRHAEDLLWMASWKVLAPGSTADGDSIHAEPASCEVKLWETCAKDWGGQVRRGDVVLLQDVEFLPASISPPSEACLVLSPKNGIMPPAPVVLYRTVPRREAVPDDYVYRPGARGAAPANEGARYCTEDQALRPDLTLARSDVGIRRVAEMAQWCAEWVGGEGPGR